MHPLLRCKQVVHAVQPRGLSNDEARGAQRTGGKERRAFRRVNDLQGLALTVKSCLVLPGDRAAAKGKNTDLPAIPPHRAAMPAIDGFAVRRGDRIIEQGGGAAGRVVFLTVVPFHDLDIKTGKRTGSLRAQKTHDLYAEGQIGASKNGKLRRSVMDGRCFNSAVPGGG